MTNNLESSLKAINVCHQKIKFIEFYFAKHDRLYLEKTLKIVGVVIEVLYGK